MVHVLISTTGQDGAPDKTGVPGQQTTVSMEHSLHELLISPQFLSQFIAGARFFNFPSFPLVCFLIFLRSV